MLDVMRKNAGSWVVKVLLGVIALVFIFFMGGGGQLAGGATSLAVVGDSKISLTDFERARNNNRALARERFGDGLTPEILAALDIPSLSLNQLVDQAVLRAEAERLGLRVPDAAVRSEIREIGAFQRNGQFSPQAYRTVMQRQGMSPAGFETSLRNDLLVEQLVDVVRRGVHVTEDEAFNDFARDSEKLVLDYVKVTRENVEDGVEIVEDELVGFYEDHREEYRVPEALRIRYLAYRPDAFADPDSIDDEAIEEYYELNVEEEFTRPENVSARHILKRAAPEDDEESRDEARAALAAIAERLAAGEDFAELAEAESDDKGSAVKGGDLGAFGRGQMVKPFEDVAFTLDVGETSDIIESRFGFHIIRVYERSEGGTKSLEDARAGIAEKLAGEAARGKAFDAAASDALAVREGAKLDTIAAERSTEIAVTPPVTRNDTVADVGPAAPLVEAAARLRGGDDDVSDPVRVDDVYYVLQIEERVESFVPGLDSMRDDVTEAHRAEKAAELAREKATEAMDSLKSGKSVADVAEAAGYESGETQAFTRRGGFVGGIGNVPGLKEVAFDATEEGTVLPRAFVHGDAAYAFVLKSREPAERDAFDEVKDERLSRLRRNREQVAVSEFVRELKEQTKISYNQAMLEQLFASAR